MLWDFRDPEHINVNLLTEWKHFIYSKDIFLGYMFTAFEIQAWLPDLTQKIGNKAKKCTDSYITVVKGLHVPYNTLQIAKTCMYRNLFVVASQN